jgi:glycosyltransferase involved in cell wall biosynthesis
MLGFMWQALRSKNTNMLPRPHAIIGSTKHPFAALAGRILAKRYQVPFLYEVRDLWSQGLLETGRISRYNPLLAVFKWIEKGCIKSSARILTIAPLLRNYFTERGVAPEQISWLQNGIDLQLSPALPPKNDTDVFTYMYFGAHNFDNSLDNILRAMQILESRVDAAEINLRLIGAGARKAELVKLAYSLGLKRVNFEDAVAKLDVPKLATQADAFVFSVVDSEATNKYGLSPNKLFDFMASGRPILYASSAQNNPVADADAGLCISSSSPENLAQAMLDLANMPLAERQAMGRRGRAYIEENHSLNAVAAKLADILNKVSSGA